MHKKDDWPSSQHKEERPGIFVVKEITPANKGSESRNIKDHIRANVPVLCTLIIIGDNGLLQRLRGSAAKGESPPAPPWRSDGMERMIDYETSRF